MIADYIKNFFKSVLPEDALSRELIERRIVLGNLQRMQPVLWGVIAFTAVIVACTPIILQRATNDFGAAYHIWPMMILRGIWIAINLFAVCVIRHILASNPEKITPLHTATEMGTVFANMLMAIILVCMGYAYNPSLETFFITILALLTFVRMSFFKGLVVTVLPCIPLLYVLTEAPVGVVQTSHFISLGTTLVLAMIIFRVMYINGVQYLMQQITIQRQVTELELLATTDSLTQLANRRRLDEELDKEWRRMLRDGSPLSLLMIDIDHFKAYNDLYGHLAGDECLKSVASVIGRYTNRGGDTGARYGGEEFAVLLPGVGLGGAAAVAENIRKDIRALQIAHAGDPEKYLSVSIGVAATPAPLASSLPDFLYAADRALYQAKAEGRNRVALAPA